MTLLQIIHYIFYHNSFGFKGAFIFTRRLQQKHNINRSTFLNRSKSRRIRSSIHCRLIAHGQRFFSSILITYYIRFNHIRAIGKACFFFGVIGSFFHLNIKLVIIGHEINSFGHIRAQKIAKPLFHIHYAICTEFVNCCGNGVGFFINNGFDRQQHIDILKVFEDIQPLYTLKFFFIGKQTEFVVKISVADCKAQFNFINISADIVQIDGFAKLYIAVND